MDIDLFVAVHYDPAHCTTRPCEAWDPRPRSPQDDERLPNVVCAWLDPFWSGLTCEREHGAVVAVGKQCAVVFRIRGTIRPMAPSTAQRLCADYHFTKEAPSSCWPTAPDAPRSLCDSLKLHFLRVQRNVTERRPMSNAGREALITDFLYSTAIPLFELQPSSSSFSTFGVFNYNYDFGSAEPLPGFCLAAFPVARACPPPYAQLQSLPGPTPEYHQRVVTLCEWVATMLGRIQPNGLKSAFINMRTLCRDRGASFLFQHLHLLFDLPGSPLPLTLAPYALAGALAVNGGLSASDVSERLIPAALAADGVARRLLMRLLRDFVACFTLCAVEGVYWPDRSLDVDVEDQPFPCAFMPASRFFPKDDCEGGAARVQQVVLLLRTMARIPLPELLTRIRAMPSFAHLLGQLPSAEVDALVRACRDLGGLLEAGVLDVQTIVGDVCLQSLQGAATADGTTTYGHSFSVGIFRDVASGGFEPITSLIETTGWQRAPVPGYDAEEEEGDLEPLKDLLSNLLLGLRRVQGDGASGALCNVMPPDMEDRIYQGLRLGRDRVYFTPQRSGCVYGASLHDLRRHGASPRPTQERPFFMSTRAFIEALRPGAADKPAGWPSDPDAERMLALHDALRAEIPALRRCLRPPPRTEAEYEALMRARWSPLPANLAPWRGVAGVLLTVPLTSPADADAFIGVVKDALHSPKLEVGAFPFMSSVLFNVRLRSHQ